MSTALETAIHSHSNLNAFASVKALLESGIVYGGINSDTASAKIIVLCDKEIQRLLRMHDRAMEQLIKKKEAPQNGVR